jgi:hypothetical protein
VREPRSGALDRPIIKSSDDGGTSGCLKFESEGAVRAPQLYFIAEKRLSNEFEETIG